MIAVSGREPFGAGLGRRGAPFAAILLVGFVLFLVSSPKHWWYFAAAAAVAATAVVSAFRVPWERLPPLATALVPLAVVLSIALLREGQGGGISGYGALFLLPTLWAACYGSRTQLLIVLAAMLAAFWLPIVIVGAPYYPSNQWRGGGLLVLIVGLFGLVIQQLLFDRAEAELRLREASAFELHDDVVQNLTVAQLALAVGDAERAQAAVGEALKVGQGIVESLLSSQETQPGSFVRRDPERREGP